jgi:hypothetical protein
MAAILTAEDVVRRIAAECAYVDERGGVGIRLEPAAAIVRRYGEQFRRQPRRKPMRRSSKPEPFFNPSALPRTFWPAPCPVVLTSDFCEKNVVLYQLHDFHA